MIGEEGPVFSHITPLSGPQFPLCEERELTLQSFGGYSGQAGSESGEVKVVPPFPAPGL